MELKSGPANLARGAERAHGRLVLDGRRLRFEPDAGDAQRRLDITDIKRLERTWTKVLGALPVAPNGLDVVMRNGERFCFTVAGRKAWIEAIEHARADTPRGG